MPMIGAGSLAPTVVGGSADRAPITYGAIGSRPSTGQANELYYATDEGKLYQWDGSTWQFVAATNHDQLTGVSVNDHHAQAHAIDGADHTASGLTAGQVLQALTATSFGFAGMPGHDHSASGDGGVLSGGRVDTYIDLDEQGSDPAAPSTGRTRIFVRPDGNLYQKDDAGAVANLAATASGGAGAPMGAPYVTTAADPDLTAEKVLGTDVIATAAVASLPAAAIAGKLVLPSDGIHVYRDTGSALVPWGPIWPMTRPVNTDFSWINQGTATITDANGMLHLSAPASAAANARLRVKAAPATPYTITAYLIPLLLQADFHAAGLLFREVATGELHTFAFGWATSRFLLASAKWASPTSFTADYTTLNAQQFLQGGIWLRIADDGTNRICSVSNDGYNWLVVHSVSRVDFLTADQVGFYVNANNASFGLGVSLVSWKQA
jgi:hypothetical protein